ncbi:hypothetical protein [Desulfosarcina widdelii]|uniref:hypothetical protein n=1 Tax=Desulfosarcina widdelii TaxID=947919 RepID=UPI0012D34EE3|nr:hypothetical protein [Desulfosarcina widdelii]
MVFSFPGVCFAMLADSAFCPPQYGQQAFLCYGHIIGRKQKVYREMSQFYGSFYRFPGEIPGSRENLGMRTEAVTRCGGEMDKIPIGKIEGVAKSRFPDDFVKRPRSRLASPEE